VKNEVSHGKKEERHVLHTIKRKKVTFCVENAFRNTLPKERQEEREDVEEELSSY
jgi:hypothetical protein